VEVLNMEHVEANTPCGLCDHWFAYVWTYVWWWCIL